MKADLVQAQGLQQFEGRTQMAVMDRVEGPAEDTHRIHEDTLPESMP